MAADLAAEAERAGWDAFFVWEGVWAVDAWVSLTAAAMRTGTIHLGTMLTPVPRRLPWELASQTVTLDNLSGGRVILSVGLGAADDRWFLFEEDRGRKVRAEQLDEGLELITRLWRGEPVSFEGRHYRAKPAGGMLPPALARPEGIPIWVVGQWPAPRSMRRVARWNGWLPYFKPPEGDAKPDELNRPSADLLAEGISWLGRERATLGRAGEPLDVVMEGNTQPDEAGAATVRGWAEAGATWWLEANWSLSDKDVVEESRKRLRAGPTRI